MNDVNSKNLDTVRERERERESYSLAKNKKGITLVALVITIIILLILAGISIANLTGSGLFENAKLSKEKSEAGQKQEEQTLGDYGNIIEEYVNGNREENIDDFLSKKSSELSQNGITLRTDRVENLVGGYITFGNWCYFNITLTSVNNLTVTQNAELISEGLPLAALDTAVQVQFDSRTIGTSTAYVMEETGNLCINIPTEIPSGTTMHFAGLYLTK